MQFRVCGPWYVSRWAKAEVRDISSCGVSFRRGKPCPIGSCVEMAIAWPAKRNQNEAISLQATGIILRLERGRTAVRLTSRELRPAETVDSVFANS